MREPISLSISLRVGLSRPEFSHSYFQDNNSFIVDVVPGHFVVAFCMEKNLLLVKVVKIQIKIVFP